MPLYGLVLNPRGALCVGLRDDLGKGAVAAFGGDLPGVGGRRRRVSTKRITPPRSYRSTGLSPENSRKRRRVPHSWIISWWEVWPSFPSPLEEGFDPGGGEGGGRERRWGRGCLGRCCSGFWRGGCTILIGKDEQFQPEGPPLRHIPAPNGGLDQPESKRAEQALGEAVPPKKRLG